MEETGLYVDDGGSQDTAFGVYEDLTIPHKTWRQQKSNHFLSLFTGRDIADCQRWMITKLNVHPRGYILAGAGLTHDMVFDSMEDSTKGFPRLGCLADHDVPHGMQEMKTIADQQIESVTESLKEAANKIIAMIELLRKQMHIIECLTEDRDRLQEHLLDTESE